MKGWGEKGRVVGSGGGERKRDGKGGRDRGGRERKNRKRYDREGEIYS